MTGPARAITGLNAPSVFPVKAGARSGDAAASRVPVAMAALSYIRHDGVQKGMTASRPARTLSPRSRLNIRGRATPCIAAQPVDRARKTRLLNTAPLSQHSQHSPRIGVIGSPT